MTPTNLDAETLTKIQELIERNFMGRDELYAAADSLDDESHERICRRLADHLAANAIELQQIVAASGVDPAGPLDNAAIARALLELARSNRGESSVLKAAAAGEQTLKNNYDQAIKSNIDQDAESVLRRQREEVKFGVDVLRNIDNPRTEQGNAKD